MTQVVEVPGYGDVEFPDDMSDEQIAAAIRKNMAPQQKTEPFRGQARPVSMQPFPDVYAGAGGFNPMLPRIAGATDTMSRAAGVDPTKAGSNFAIAAGPGDAALSAAAHAGMMPVSGVAGLAQGAWNKLTPKSMNGPDAAERVRQVQDLAYQPRTQVGGGMAKVANTPFDLYGQGTNYVGEKAADITGSPAIGAAIKTVGDIAPSLLTDGASMRGGPRGKYAADAAPTTEQLSKAADAAYKRADDSGIAMTADSFHKMRTELASDLGKDGLDPSLHPRATAAMKRVTEEQGPITLQKAETLRRVALAAEDTLEKSDARASGKIVDALDDYVDNLKDSDLVSGNKKDAGVLKDARALYTRKRKAEDIERLVRRAELSPSGVENGLRIEFRSLAKNDRRFNRFNAEEKAAILKVAKGGLAENALRLLGKAAPTGIVSGGLGAGAGFAFGGPVGAALVPAAGIAGRVGAGALTARNATRAGDLMRRGPTPEPSFNQGLDMSQVKPAPSKGLFDAIQSATEKERPARPKTEVLKDIQRLQAVAQKLTPKQMADRSYMEALKQELARLHAELAQPASRGVSGDGPGARKN